FRDDIYRSMDPGPNLTNAITVRGQTISAKEGLILTPGRLTLPEAVAGRLRIRSATTASGSACAPVEVILDTPSPVQGFTLAIAHDPAELDLTGITISGTATEANGADFSVKGIDPRGGI